MIAAGSFSARSVVQRGSGTRASGATLSEGLPAATPWGGPILAHFRVSRRSLCFGMAPSSLLELGQNRLRHGGSILCHQALMAMRLRAPSECHMASGVILRPNLVFISVCSVAATEVKRRAPPSVLPPYLVRPTRGATHYACRCRNVACGEATTSLGRSVGV